ncbi:MAG TPA: Txe/YoeB family addiction module toxin [Allosphingosinicella sp.]
MKLAFLPPGWEDYLYWQGEDPKTVARINELIRDALRSPFRGLGKPEPLRGNWSGWWLRRIDGEHRLVYRVCGKGDEQRLEIAQCRYHY